MLNYFKKRFYNNDIFYTLQIETVLFADALNFLLHVMEEMAVEYDITTEQLDCDNERRFDMGDKIVEEIKKVGIQNVCKIVLYNNLIVNLTNYYDSRIKFCLKKTKQTLSTKKK